MINHIVIINCYYITGGFVSVVAVLCGGSGGGDGGCQRQSKNAARARAQIELIACLHFVMCVCDTLVDTVVVSCVQMRHDLTDFCE